VTDAVGPSGERFGEPRMLATIEGARRGSAHDIVATLRDAVAGFRGSVPPADDVTIVVIGRQRP
jgi:serine phosphatase RsbU (regulator of sigma subunit)